MKVSHFLLYASSLLLILIGYTFGQPTRPSDNGQNIRFNQRTLPAQIACAIPGPRGFRGERGDTGPQGAQGPQGLPGILGAEIELIETGYNPLFQNVPIGIIGDNNVDILNPSQESIEQVGVLVSRAGFQVKVLISAVINVFVMCDVDAATGFCSAFTTGSEDTEWQYVASFTVTQNTTNLVGSPTISITDNINPMVLNIPININALPTGFTGNLLMQHILNIDPSVSGNSQFYARVNLEVFTSSSVPTSGATLSITGNMVSAIYYQDLITS